MGGHLITLYAPESLQTPFRSTYRTTPNISLEEPKLSGDAHCYSTSSGQEHLRGLSVLEKGADHYLHYTDLFTEDPIRYLNKPCALHYVKEVVIITDELSLIHI